MDLVLVGLDEFHDNGGFDDCLVVEDEELLDAAVEPLELLVLEGEGHEVGPHFPVGLLDLDGLLEDGLRLVELAHHLEAPGEVGPAFCVAFVDGDCLGEGLDCFIELVETHVGAPHHEPRVGVVGVD